MAEEFSKQLSNGWWLGTNYSFRAITRILQVACRVADIRFGIDFRIGQGRPAVDIAKAMGFVGIAANPIRTHPSRRLSCLRRQSSVVTAGHRVLADTSALYALLSRTDAFHDVAAETYRRLLVSQRELWLTSYVLVEFGGLTERRMGFAPLKSFYQSIDGVFDTLWVEPELHGRAWQEVDRRSGGRLNFVDWTVVLAARGLGASIFTFDEGFAKEGAPGNTVSP